MGLRWLGALALVLVAMAGGGCSEAVRTSEIMPPEVQVRNHHAGTVAVTCEPRAWEGGTNNLATIALADRDAWNHIAEAAGQTLEKNGVFAGVRPREQADYWLELLILQNRSGFGFYTDVSVHWRLSKRNPEMPVWEQFVFSSGHSNNLSGYARVRASAEDAMQQNIKAGVEAIGGLNLAELRERPTTLPGVKGK